MSSTKIAAGAMIARNIRRHTLLEVTRPPRSGNGFLGRCFTSVSKGGSEGLGSMGDKAKQTMDEVLGGAKESSQKLKDGAMAGGGGNTATPGAGSTPCHNPELNHGVETTDSSCEDVRDRPGGYS